jgi:hypothetical protein
MSYSPDKYHRHSIRQRGYDYARAGAYFITICIENHHHLFGEIKNGIMELNNAGMMINKCWMQIQNKFPNNPKPTDNNRADMESQSTYAQEIWMV